MTPQPEAGVHPVVLPVSQGEYLRLSLKNRVRVLSRYARKAVAASAGMRGIMLTAEDLKKDPASGRPLPLAVGYWSVSHKPRYVAGIFSPEPVGIDIERIRPYNPGLRPKTAALEEWRLADPEEPLTFFRYWTAKEAVLKIGGVGIADLLKCRVTAVIDRRRLLLRYQQKEFQVCQTYVEDHVAAVVEGNLPVRWVLPGSSDPAGDV